MSIRNDITIYWDLSPRIIEVAAPTDEISIQDLVDTVREMEEELVNLSYPKILDCGGKQFLGGIKYAGITVELRNARLKFEARDGPVWARCKVTGGNLVAYDINDAPIEAIEVSSYTQVTVEMDVSAALLSGSSDWTDNEKKMVRSALGVDGDKVAAVGGQLQDIQADLDNPNQYKADVAGLALETSVQDVKAKTDNLPPDPASQSLVQDVKDLVEIDSTATQDILADVADIKAKTDNLPADPARESSVQDVKAKTDGLPADPATQASIDAINVLVTRALGLAQENYRLFNLAYDAEKNLTSGIIKIYSSAADCNNDVNPTATYQITATYDGDNKMTSYKVVKQ